MHPILEVQHISKKYQSANLFDKRRDYPWVLKDVSFSMMPGQCIILTGDNGSGKSTLLKIISRIIYPTEGTVIVKGSVAPMLELGTGFHPELTGRENIYLFGSLMGIRRQDIKSLMAKIIDFSGIEKSIDNKVRTYSSGMILRLAFSISSALRPDLVLIDELLSVADQRFREQCLQKIIEMVSEGSSIVIVQHEEELLTELPHDYVHLEKGSIVNKSDALR